MFRLKTQKNECAQEVRSGQMLSLRAESDFLTGRGRRLELQGSPTLLFSPASIPTPLPFQGFFGKSLLWMFVHRAEGAGWDGRAAGSPTSSRLSVNNLVNRGLLISRAGDDKLVVGGDVAAQDRGGFLRLQGRAGRGDIANQLIYKALEWCSDLYQLALNYLARPPGRH